jgi:hypothetical protein
MIAVWHQLDAFLRARPVELGQAVQERRRALLVLCVSVVLIGAGIFGAVMGSWRSPMQALYTGMKLPLVILLTTVGNGLLNGMLAALLGLNVTFRQSLVLVMMSFAITAAILGGFSSVAWFFILNTPPLSGSTQLASPEYQLMQLMLASFIAFAGIVGNVHLLPLLTQWAKSARIARRVLLAWLAGNLLLGSQIAWILRPFIWDPTGPIRFIGREYLRGSFYETVFEAIRRLIFS